MQWRWINITNVENFSAKKGIILLAVLGIIGYLIGGAI